MADFDLFHPDRLAGRILGMGDVLTLIDKAKEAFDEKEAEEAAPRLMEGTFTLEDFLDQMQQVKKMGPLGSLVGMIPGMPKEMRNTEIDDGEIARIEAIIHSMTTAERRNPKLIDGSRRSRIAQGSGVTTADVNGLLKQFNESAEDDEANVGGWRTRQAARQKKKAKKGGRVTPKGARQPLDAEGREGARSSSRA